MKGKRSGFPFSFAASYPGDGKLKVGLSFLLESPKRNHFSIAMRWFITDADPPENFGRLGDVLPCIADGFGKRRVDVLATFSYPRGKVGSLFRPIQLTATSTLFDEIVGFAGIKRDSAGKFLHGLTVTLGEDELTHVVRFGQTVELTENLPDLLIPRAQDISTLALEKNKGSLMKPTSRHVPPADWFSFVKSWGTSTSYGLIEELDDLRLHKPKSRTLRYAFAPRAEVSSEQEGGRGEQPTTTEDRPPEALLVEGEIKDAPAGFLAGLSGIADAPSAALTQAILDQSKKLAEIRDRISRIESILSDVVKGIEHLRIKQPSVSVPIQTFAPDPYEVLKPFTVVVTPDGEEFEASFFDANLYGSGDTEEEAISDLKATMIESFERLSELGDDKLGPAMIKQKRVLAAHIRRIT